MNLLVDASVHLKHTGHTAKYFIGILAEPFHLQRISNKISNQLKDRRVQ